MQFKPALYIILRNRVEIGTISAVDYATARKRAVAAYGRCEVMAVAGGYKLPRAVKGLDSYTHGRSPYATPGFEARRAALIEAHKANA